MSEVLCPYCGGEMRRVMTIWSDGEWYECKDCGSRSPLVRPMNYDDALKTALVRADSPVVRCRECKHRGTCNCPMLQEIEFYDEDDGWDYRDIDNTDDDGFCHNGAKMDGGAEK